MRTFAYRIVNVFTVGDDPFSGNPLCVFEDGRALSETEMKKIARQFNLSETTFLIPGGATPRVRIFTPTFEMPFAGHPTLGTAHVARALGLGGDRLVLSMIAGDIPVVASGDEWRLTARMRGHRPCEATRAELADMLGLAEPDVRDGAMWVDTGSEQLVVPIASAEAVHRAAPRVELLRRYGKLREGRYLAYAFAGSGEDVTARFFFPVGDAVVEDPATGSACANLGGWYVAQGAPLPLRRIVRQGEHVERPSLLRLAVDTEGIHVSGRVMELARGELKLLDLLPGAP